MAMLARRRNGKGRGEGGPGTPQGQGPEPLPLMDVGQVEDTEATEAVDQGQEARGEERGRSGPANGSPAEAPGLEIIGHEVAVLQNVDASRTPATKGTEGTMVPRRLWSTAAASAQRNPWAAAAGPRGEEGQDFGEHPQWGGGPQGDPVVYGPLFTPEQLEYLERWDRPGGLVNLGGRKAAAEPSLQRPEFLELEDGALRAGQGEGARQVPRPDRMQEYLMMEIQRLRAENDKLRKGNQSEETYATPDMEVEKRGAGRAPDQGHPKGKPAERGQGQAAESSEELIREDQPQDGNAHLNLILKLMEGMQQIQKKILDNGHGGDEVNAEVVKSAVDLPMLPDLSADTGPIDLQDWLTMVGPVMADLSDTSQEWWELMLKHTKSWYDKYMTEPPMQRLLMTPTAPLEVSNGKWRRVERRAVTLLMKALPDQVKEELIATKSLDVFSLVCRLMLLYQPGGVAERPSILKNLEQPQEAVTIQAAVQGIRRWLRWKRRAEEIGVSLPDPSVLSRGLHRLTKKVLEGNKDLSFNISLARSTLQVDTVPNYGTISTYCEHLLSELEQLVHTEKKTVKAPDRDGKIKKFEGVGQASGGGGGNGWEGRPPKQEGDVRERKPCLYYLTDAGCRRGRQCTFSHEAKDEKNRCYECGAVDHYRKDCPRKQQDKEGGSRTEKSPSKIAKVTEVDDEQSNHQGEDQAEYSGATTSTSKGNAKNAKDVKEGDGLQSVLEEAGKMLRSLNIKAATSTGRDDRDVRLNDLQKQLDQMKRLRALRFVKVSKIDYLPEYGLRVAGLGGDACYARSMRGR